MKENMDDAIKEAFGDRIEKMYVMDSLATDPKML